MKATQASTHPTTPVATTVKSKSSRAIPNSAVPATRALPSKKSTPPCHSWPVPSPTPHSSPKTKASCTIPTPRLLLQEGLCPSNCEKASSLPRTTTLPWPWPLRPSSHRSFPVPLGSRHRCARRAEGRYPSRRKKTARWP